MHVITFFVPKKIFLSPPLFCFSALARCYGERSGFLGFCIRCSFLYFVCYDGEGGQKAGMRGAKTACPSAAGGSARWPCAMGAGRSGGPGAGAAKDSWMLFLPIIYQLARVGRFRDWGGDRSLPPLPGQDGQRAGLS